MQTDTIAAIATPMGKGGIGIVKISGPRAIAIFDTLFRFGQKHEPNTCVRQRQQKEKERGIHYGCIVDPQDQKRIDEVIVTVMPKPNSYTREDVIEINAHAGPAVLRDIMEVVLSCGARLAEPGEFTLRAFLNGRIDLIQAEAVIDVINASNRGALEMARQHLMGKMTNQVLEIRSAILEILTEVEAQIEFGEEIESQNSVTSVGDNFTNIIDSIQSMITKYDQFHVIADGINLVIVGKPNVGKSSLLNALVDNERALVTQHPGTTRDYIIESISIAGLPVNVIDTAGVVNDSQDPIEKLGIEKTWKQLTAADMILFVVDGSRPLDQLDHIIFSKLNIDTCIIVQSKLDLPVDPDHYNYPDRWLDCKRLKISALQNIGLDVLKENIYRIAVQNWESSDEGNIVPNLRQTQNFKRALGAIRSALRNIGEESMIDLSVIDIREALQALDEIMGINTGQDVIDNIFEKFCIGK